MYCSVHLSMFWLTSFGRSSFFNILLWLQTVNRYSFEDNLGVKHFSPLTTHILFIEGHDYGKISSTENCTDLPRYEIIYNACQKSLEHLGHFFIIRISNHSHQVQIPPRPRNNVDFEGYCPSIPAESRIVLACRFFDHNTTLF